MALTWLLDGSRDKLDAMLDEARWLLEQHEQHEVAKEEELKELKEKWDVVQQEKARWEAAGLVELCRKRKELEMQLEFLHLHRALEQLRASRLPEEISALVMTVVKHLPAQLPKQSHFNQRLREVVQEQRQRLLASFHAQFETHLEQPNEAQQSVHLWSAFLESGKSWLLSFALVTLLPLRLGESSQRTLEVLQRDVLEEALVPLWGRFRYHLAAARESSEEEQVLWTFVYSKSHVELLCSLCTQLTAAPALQQLGGGSRPGTLQEAATAHVTETAIRLLRAHVALLLVSPSVSASVSAVLTSTTLSDENEAGGAGAGAGAGAGVALMRLIEACLDIDQHLFPLLPVGTRDCIPLTVHVVCDHRPSLEAWARCDNSVLCGPRSQVSESFSSWGAAFSSAFVNLWASAAPAAAPVYGASASASASSSISASGAGALVANEAATQGEVGDRKFCYRSTYACLSSLSLACSRYKLLPRKGQTALVRAVVLPLLAALLATLLLRMRSCPALLASPSSSGGAASEEDVDFSLALSYADRALQTLLINGAGNIASPDAAALTDLWAAVSSWVPRTVSPEVEALMVEDYAVTPNTLLRRVLDWAAASAAGAGRDVGSDAGAAGAGRVDIGAGDGELLAGAIETARHIALTLRTQ